MIERSLEVNKDVYDCFIDYIKAFDRVRHEAVMDILQELDLDKKDQRTIKNMYWQHTAKVRTGHDLGDYQHIKRGERQGSVLSTDLLSTYSETIIF